MSLVSPRICPQIMTHSREQTTTPGTPCPTLLRILCGFFYVLQSTMSTHCRVLNPRTPAQYNLEDAKRKTYGTPRLGSHSMHALRITCHALGMCFASPQEYFQPDENIDRNDISLSTKPCNSRKCHEVRCSNR